MISRIDLAGTRWRIWIVNAALSAALCASAAYWLAHLKAPAASIIPPILPAAPTPVDISAAASLFGSRISHGLPDRQFQLKGVIVADVPADSVALMSSGGSVRVLPVNAEIAPGVRLAEVHPRYVMLADGGASRRIDLPENAKDIESAGKGVENAIGTVTGAVAGAVAGSESKPDMTRHLSRARHK
jgi:general secretion pathway protein C